MADIVYIDDDLTQAQPCSLPLFSAPFETVNIDYVLTQDFWQLDADRAPLAFNTPHPDYPEFLLVSEGVKRDLGGGVVEWTRTYAKVPVEFSEPGGNFAYNFIGFFGSFGSATTSATGRERFVRNAPVSITKEFFLVDGLIYSSYLDIPTIAATRYYYGSDPTLDLDYLSNSPPFQQASTPSKTDYLALVTADAGTQDSYSIIVEESTLTRWLGNIFVRETRRVKAI